MQTLSLLGTLSLGAGAGAQPQVPPRLPEPARGLVERCAEQLRWSRLNLLADSAALRRKACECAAARGAETATTNAAPPAASARPAAILLQCMAQAVEADPEAMAPAWRGEFAAALGVGPQASGQGARTAGAGYTPPRFRGDCKPVYPLEARRAEATGSTAVEFKVSPSGEVLDARVVRSAGTTPAHKLLDFAAVYEAMQCRFAPAVVGTDAVEGTTEVRFEWSLVD